MIHGDLTSPELRKRAPEAIALLPLAATEQHGGHLPLCTDTALVSELARRAEAARPEQISLLPTLWVGSSHHHLGFAGTVSLSSETYIRVLEDLLECLLASGYQRILLLNGHGGNVTPGNEAVYRTMLRHASPRAPWIVLASYWQLAGEEWASAAFMDSPRLTHACEYETSMMLALRADWVNMPEARGFRTERHSRFYDPLGYQPSRVSTAESFSQMTPHGAMGSPEAATPEKGRRLFDLAALVLHDFLGEFSTWSLERKF